MYFRDLLIHPGRQLITLEYNSSAHQDNSIAYTQQNNILGASTEFPIE